MLSRFLAVFSRKTPQSLGAQGCCRCGRKEKNVRFWENVHRTETNIRKMPLFRVLKFCWKPLISLDLSPKGSLNELSIKTRIDRPPVGERSSFI